MQLVWNGAGGGCRGPEWDPLGTECVCNEHPLLKGFGGHLGSGSATPWGHALAPVQGTGLAPWQQAGWAPTSGCWRGGTGWVTGPGRLVWVGSTGVVLGLFQSLSHTPLGFQAVRKLVMPTNLRKPPVWGGNPHGLTPGAEKC